MMTVLKMAEPNPNPDMHRPEHSPFRVGKCMQAFLIGGQQPMPIKKPQINPQKATYPTNVFMKDAVNTVALSPMMAIIQIILLGTLLSTMLEMVTPMPTMIMVMVKRIDMAVLLVSSPSQQRQDEMYGVRAPNVQIDPSTTRVSTPPDSARAASAFTPIAIFDLSKLLIPFISISRCQYYMIILHSFPIISNYTFYYQPAYLSIIYLYIDRQRNMFTRLRELEKKYIYQKKEQPSYTQKSAARAKLKQNSYSRLHNKTRRMLPNQSYDYQVVSNQSYTYQGQWYNNQKHGEGIAFLKNGTMIVGHWERDKLNGRSLIITPYGALISAAFIDNKLNGWVLAQYSNKVIITNLFFEDRVDGPRIVFEGSQQFWIASNFTPDGQFIEIINVEKGQRGKLPLFFENDTLFQLFQNMVVNKKYAYDFERIKCIQLISKTQYIGYLDTDHLPSGLGATYSDSQCFSGNFQKGYLQDFGRMIFANGDIYHGGIITGAFLGNGIYYNPRKNLTFVIDTFLEGGTEVIQQQNGYYHLDFKIQIGERMHKQDTIFLSLATQNLLRNLEKYYHQYYIQTRIKQQEAFSNISEQQSENERINDLDDAQNSPGQNKLKKKSSMKKWIGNNSHQNGFSEQMSQQNEHIYNQVQQENKAYFSPQNNSLENYFSLKINQNQELLEKEKYQKQKPNASSVKKNMFIAIPDKNALMASKSLDIVQLTFRGNNSQQLKSGRTGRSGRDENGRQYEYADIDQTPRHRRLKIQEQFSEKNSSNISNMDQKLLGVMKKSNFRRKIFE